MKKIPAFSKKVSSNALRPKKDSEHAREGTSLEQVINATEDEKINEMIKVSKEMAEYHH